MPVRKKPRVTQAAVEADAAKPSPRPSRRKPRDVEKAYSVPQTVAKLRRLADAIETGKRFAIMVAGERVFVPADAVFNIAHEREGDTEEVEFQFTWKRR